MSMPKLNRKLVLEAPERVSDGAGGFTAAWVAQGEIWAELKAGSGRERNLEGVTASTQKWTVTIRAAAHGAPSRPKPEQRFRAGNRVFRILAVAEADPEGRYLKCAAEEEVAA